MITCPNCKATNIPDDALFCPKCGKPLSKVSASWKKKYTELQKELIQLQEEKQSLHVFDHERQNLMKTLEQDSNFESVMKENIAIIRYNRGFVLRMNRFFLIIEDIIYGMMVASCPIGLYMMMFENRGPKWLWFFVPVILMYLGGVLLFSTIEDGHGLFIHFSPKAIIKNQYITNFYIPFIEGHRQDYSDAGINKADYGILEDEIIEPEKISQMIAQKIEEIAKQLINIEYQMQLMQQMK